MIIIDACSGFGANGEILHRMDKGEVVETFNSEQMRQINTLAQCIEGYDVPMAVVDYFGTQMQDFGSCELKFVTVDETFSPADRFGTRDLRHVKIYGLTVIKKNAAAREINL